ncbi:hypothetical protein [Lewinella sp. IMCC34183]|uniref:HD domain-containing protein n=1 Tax=Lewinella sp. IMCC34183 TaxID=2248762 RepID=UPI000E2682B6|nr:hypothetical protein [Lewinella sp. IMCC34183]
MIQDYFTELSQQLAPTGLNWENVRRAYAGRAYHNLTHLDEMIGHLPQHAAPQDPVVFGVALVYHDIVHKPTRSDNEERSARSAERDLRQDTSISAERIDRCRQLILSTKQHLPSPADDGDEALLIDLDLAVLARAPDSYDQYATAVRREFWMLPYFVFRNGRTRVLTALLDRPAIYHTAFGRDHYEAPARENLWRELRNL